MTSNLLKSMNKVFERNVSLRILNNMIVDAEELQKEADNQDEEMEKHEEEIETKLGDYLSMTNLRNPPRRTRSTGDLLDPMSDANVSVVSESAKSLMESRAQAGRRSRRSSIRKRRESMMKDDESVRSVSTDWKKNVFLPQHETTTATTTTTKSLKRTSSHPKQLEALQGNTSSSDLSATKERSSRRPSRSRKLNKKDSSELKRSTSARRRRSRSSLRKLAAAAEDDGGEAPPSSAQAVKRVSSAPLVAKLWNSDGQITMEDSKEDPTNKKTKGQRRPRASSTRRTSSRRSSERDLMKMAVLERSQTSPDTPPPQRVPRRRKSDGLLMLQQLSMADPARTTTGGRSRTSLPMPKDLDQQWDSSSSSSSKRNEQWESTRGSSGASTKKRVSQRRVSRTRRIELRTAAATTTATNRSVKVVTKAESFDGIGSLSGQQQRAISPPLRRVRTAPTKPTSATAEDKPREDGSMGNDDVNQKKEPSNDCVGTVDNEQQQQQQQQDPSSLASILKLSSLDPTPEDSSDDCSYVNPWISQLGGAPNGGGLGSSRLLLEQMRARSA